MPKAALVALALSLFGCAGPAEPSVSPDAPVIDDAWLPSTATEGVSGLYRIDGTISFHAEDEEAVVSKLLIRVPSTDSVLTFRAGDERRMVNASLSLQILGPKQTFECELSVVDSKGRESLPHPVRIQLL